ncbi:hypothetical protein GCM10027169_01430 [Gordonia jinhuaensis]|uniref:Uncharacterized protein n=1 Tax=Gordonia jinhuaensis TaxID=1517702 RepID=A0A916WZH9_9ACTN|nr:hypothetical protein [Gordonia jinhuaensis]GGB44686.1 hypothetical protein GCM10011489_35190 [Gordonia jinhuaensis]
MTLEFHRPESGRGAPWTPPLVGPVFADQGLCGVSASAGLFRMHDGESGPIAQRFVDAVYPRTRSLHADVFGFDWRARQFAVTRDLGHDDTVADSAGTVVVLDPFDVSITPWTTLEQFEQALSLPVAEEFLGPALFTSWRSAKDVSSLDLDHCAGASVPAFYGGQLDVSNLDYNDVDVYLTFIATLWLKSQNLPADSTPPDLSDLTPWRNQ